MEKRSKKKKKLMKKWQSSVLKYKQHQTGGNAGHVSIRKWTYMPLIQQNDSKRLTEFPKKVDQ